MPIIAFSGYPKSGKSTVAIRLANFLNFKRFYTGGLIREAAQKLNMPIEKYYELLSKTPELEKEFDQKQEKAINSENNLIVEGRISPFIKSCFEKINILVKIDIKEAAKRLKLDQGYEQKSIEELIILLEKRLSEEKKHYQDLYDIDDYLDKKYFQIIIDTTKLSKDEVFEKVLKEIKQKTRL